MSTPDCDCGTDPGGFHAFHCARYATVDDNWRLETNSTLLVPNDDDALPRLKALLADTKAMVVQAESLVASMREPANYFRRY